MLPYFTGCLLTQRHGAGKVAGLVGNRAGSGVAQTTCAIQCLPREASAGRQNETGGPIRKCSIKKIPQQISFVPRRI